MSIVHSQKIKVLAALCCFALLGAGRYRPHTADGPGERALFSRPMFSWVGTRDDREWCEECPDSTSTTETRGKPRTAGGLSLKRQRCYDKSYDYRLKKRRCCQLLRGESYYDPDPPYCHPTHGYHETLWRRFPEGNLVGGECLPGYETEVIDQSVSEIPEHSGEIPSPLQNGDPPAPMPSDEKVPGTPGSPVVSPPSPMPPEGTSSLPTHSSFVNRPVSRSTAASELPPYGTRGKVLAVTVDRRTSVSTMSVDSIDRRSTVSPRSLTPATGLDVIPGPDVRRGNNPSSERPHELFSPPERPIRQISHDSDKNQVPQSSPGWRPRRK